MGIGQSAGVEAKVWGQWVRRVLWLVRVPMIIATRQRGVADRDRLVGLPLQRWADGTAGGVNWERG